MLGTILKAAGLRSDARYIVFTCADLFRGKNYYESIDVIDAFHPQTILAWAMNNAVLDVGHGAPLRARGHSSRAGRPRNKRTLGGRGRALDAAAPMVGHRGRSPREIRRASGRRRAPTSVAGPH